MADAFTRASQRANAQLARFRSLLRGEPGFAHKVSAALGNGQFPVVIEHEGYRYTLSRKPCHSQGGS